MLTHDYSSAPWMLVAIWAHITGGFVAVYGGLVPLLVRKGGVDHRRFGLVFTLSMLVAALTAIPLGLAMGNPWQAWLGGFSLVALATLWLYGSPARRGFGAMALGGGLVVGIAGAVVGFGNPVGGAWMVIGVFGAGLALVSLTGLAVAKSQPIVTHLTSAIFALALAWSAMFNTQLKRVTGIEWSLEMRLLVPLAFFALVAVGFALTRPVDRRPSETGSETQRFFGISTLEGLSFLALMLLAVPLKRALGWEGGVQLIGPIHGLLTVVYLVYLWRARREAGWTMPRTIGLAILGLVPFGFLLAHRVAGPTRAGA